MVKASTSSGGSLRFKTRPSHACDKKKKKKKEEKVKKWLPCQTPGVIESVLGPVRPISVYGD